MKKYTYSIVALMLAAALLAACGGGNGASQSGAASENPASQQESQEPAGEEGEAPAADGSAMTRASEGQTISVWGWDTPEFNAPMEAYIMEASGVTVNGETMTQQDEIAKITAAMAAGGVGMPDAFKLGNVDIPRLVDQGAIFDLTDLAAPYKDRLPQVAWDMVTYDGRIYGVPANSPAAGMYYRADVCEKYGVDPASLTTWDKWMEAGRKVVAESNGEVMWFNASAGKINPPLDMVIQQQYRAEILSNESKVMINSDAWRSALNKVAEIRDAGIAAEIDDWTPPWYESMKDGTVACYGNGTWFPQTFIAQAPDSKEMWTFVPFPALEEGGDRYPNFGSATCFVSSTTDKPEAAFEWVKAWTFDPGGSLKIGLEQLGVSVISNAALDDVFVNQPHEYFANNQAYWRDATEAFTKSTYIPPITIERSQSEEIWNRYYEMWWQGEISADDALQQAEQELKTKLDLE